MLQKTIKFSLYRAVVYSSLRKCNSRSVNRWLDDSITITSLTTVQTSIIKNTGQFFKHLIFIGLSINCIKQNKYKTLTLKSTIFSLWETLATYNYIF